MATCRNEKITSHGVYFDNLFVTVVLISRETVRQRRWCRLATEYAGVYKLPDYLRSDMRDVTSETVIIEK